MNARRKCHVLAAAACVATVLSPLAAAAGSDKKIVPATVCQPLVESSADTFPKDPNELLSDLLSIRYDRTGRVTNDSYTKPLGVVCPIIRDNTHKALNYVRVYYVDNRPDVADTDVLVCTLRSNVVWGWSQALDEETVNSKSTPPQVPLVDANGDQVAGAGSGVWTFTKVDVAGESKVYQETNYTLTCLIPPRFYPTDASPTGHSSIGSIVIEESEGS